MNGLNNKSRTNLCKYLKSNYSSKSKFYEEHNNSNLMTYFGIRPKKIQLNQDNKDTLSKYEEFILTKCKYSYNYRIGWTEFLNELLKWTNEKYPDYYITNDEKNNITEYINKYFLRDVINMPGYVNVPGIWGFQLIDNNNSVLHANKTIRKIVYKIDINTNEVLEEYESLIKLSKVLNLGRGAAGRYIKIKKIIDNYFYQYKEDSN